MHTYAHGMTCARMHMRTHAHAQVMRAAAEELVRALELERQAEEELKAEQAAEAAAKAKMEMAREEAAREAAARVAAAREADGSKFGGSDDDHPAGASLTPEETAARMAELTKLGEELEQATSQFHQHIGQLRDKHSQEAIDLQERHRQQVEEHHRQFQANQAANKRHLEEAVQEATMPCFTYACMHMHVRMHTHAHLHTYAGAGGHQGIR